MPRPTLALLLFLLPGMALAQDEMPAVRTDEQPAVKTQPPPPRRPPDAAAPAQAPEGTTILGEKDSPIGLYIMPWRRSGADAGLDRPARLLDDALLPLDAEVFRRQVDYHRALTQHLKKTGRDAP